MSYTLHNFQTGDVLKADELNEMDEEILNLGSEKQDTISDLDDIRNANQFWATYGETTYDDIMTAYNAGKAVFCNYNSKQFQLAYTSASIATFIAFSTATTLIYLQAKNTGTWANGSRTLQTALTAGDNISISSSGVISSAATTSSIADGAVTEAKLADEAVTEAKLSTDVAEKINNAQFEFTRETFTVAVGASATVRDQKHTATKSGYTPVLSVVTAGACGDYVRWGQTHSLSDGSAVVAVSAANTQASSISVTFVHNVIWQKD